MTNQNTNGETQAVLISCANMAASGFVIRGKVISDEWQAHAVGCRDLKEMRRIFSMWGHAFSDPATLDVLRDEFNEEMGSGGTAGFENGWDFDRDVVVKPCIKS